MKLGHFEFDPASDRLGEGPLSEVFRARDTRLDREVALKVLRPTAEIDPHGDQRFEREGRVLARLAHTALTLLRPRRSYRCASGGAGGRRSTPAFTGGLAMA